MIKTYVINSDSFVENRGNIQLDPEYFNVSNGWAVVVPKEQFELNQIHSNRLSKILLGRDLLRGEVGASLAHKAIYCDHLTHDQEWILVLEDDAVVSSDSLKSDIDQILSYITPGPSRRGRGTVVLLGYHAHSAIINKRLRVTKQWAIPTGTIGYLINRAASESLAQRGPVDFLADWPVESRKIRFFAVYPPLVRQSELAESRVDANSAYSRQTADGARDGFITRLSRIRSWSDAILVWHLIFKRALIFTFIIPVTRVLRRY